MVIEVMTNVNVPFGTVNWTSKGQNKNNGRRGIICFTSCWTQMVKQEEWRDSISDDYLYQNEIFTSISCLFRDICCIRWILHQGSVCWRQHLCVIPSYGMRRLFRPLSLSCSEVSSRAWTPHKAVSSQICAGFAVYLITMKITSLVLGTVATGHKKEAIQNPCVCFPPLPFIQL